MLAQNNGMNGPPNILQIQREFTKPGKGGALHEKTESAYVAAAKAGKAPFHYFALTSLSGPDRALFLSGYESLAAMEAEHKAMPPATAATLDRLNVPDGDLLSSADSSIMKLVPEQSMNTHDLKGARYMELSLYKIKPGHEAEWDEAVKMVKAGYAKGVPSASWATFRELYGVPGDEYLVIQTAKSAAELDTEIMAGPRFVEAMGAAGMKKLDELSAAAIESEQTNLFAIDPKMSLPPKEWVDAEPDFWAPKPVPMKKAAPAQ
jgi:hypothetical protein